MKSYNKNNSSLLGGDNKKEQSTWLSWQGWSLSLQFVHIEYFNIAIMLSYNNGWVTIVHIEYFNIAMMLSYNNGWVTR